MMRDNNMEDIYFKDYEIEIASDVNERDGIGVKVYKDENLLIEIFRDDTQKNYTVSFYKKDLPLEFVEKAIELFKKVIPQEFINYEELE
jgi:hypothetical protein